VVNGQADLGFGSGLGFRVGAVRGTDVRDTVKNEGAGFRAVTYRSSSDF
jgi:hypothetical protein